MEVTDGNLLPKPEEETVRLSELELVGAGHQPTLKKALEGQNFPPCSVTSSLQTTPALGSNGEGNCRQERKGPEPSPCTVTPGLPQPDLFGCSPAAGEGGHGEHTTPEYVYGSPSSTIWQLIPIFLVPYNIVAVYSDSRERIKHYALDKLHPFAKCFPHLSPNKNILNDYTEPKRC